MENMKHKTDIEFLRMPLCVFFGGKTVVRIETKISLKTERKLYQYSYCISSLSVQIYIFTDEQHKY